MAGKGDSYRPVDRKKYDENYDRIFGPTQSKGKPKTVRKTRINEPKRS